MKIYKTVEYEILNVETGEKHIKYKRVLKEVRCDYSGLIIDYNTRGFCSYKVDYHGDPCFGDFGKEREFVEKYDINIEFLSEPYEFYDDSYTTGEYFDQELKMIEEYKSLILNSFNDDEFPTTFSEALRFFRIRTVIKLIEDGVIKPDDLEKWIK